MPVSLWEAFEAVVVSQPSAPALIFTDGSIDFATLHADAELCAAFLEAEGVGFGDGVALQLPKRRETYALWLACLRQGAPYVFVDPNNPSHRTTQILENVKPKIMVTCRADALQNVNASKLLSAEAGLAWLDELRSSGSNLPPSKSVHGLAPAYVMFTSGSTGEPKGAVIPQQGVLSLMRWGQRKFGPMQDARFSNINPLHFDNSVFDLYCGLLSGAALVPIETSQSINPAAWVKRMREGRASVVFAVPTLFQTLDQLRLLTPKNLPDARFFVFGGEGYPLSSLSAFHARFRDQAQLINVYGPTETSCICSSQDIDEEALREAEGGLASLGRMHADFTHAVLDENAKPVASGEPGELWIGGANVALGYFGNAPETQKRFRQDPSHDRYRSIWYRTGDLVCEDEKGRLWFRGRADNQVKVRGHRIELEEIDFAIERLTDVTRAVAVVVVGLDGPEIRVAYVADKPLDTVMLERHCVATLPRYMHPASFLQLENLPQNANGKIDRRAARDILREPLDEPGPFDRHDPLQIGGHDRGLRASSDGGGGKDNVVLRDRDRR